MHVQSHLGNPLKAYSFKRNNLRPPHGSRYVLNYVLNYQLKYIFVIKTVILRRGPLTKTVLKSNIDLICFSVIGLYKNEEMVVAYDSAQVYPVFVVSYRIR